MTNSSQPSPNEGDICAELALAILRGIKFERGDADAQPYVTVQTLLAARLEIERLRPYVDAFRREEARADRLETEVDYLRGQSDEKQIHDPETIR